MTDVFVPDGRSVSPLRHPADRGRWHRPLPQLHPAGRRGRLHAAGHRPPRHRRAGGAGPGQGADVLLAHAGPVTPRPGRPGQGGGHAGRRPCLSARRAGRGLGRGVRRRPRARGAPSAHPAGCHPRGQGAARLRSTSPTTPAAARPSSPATRCSAASATCTRARSTSRCPSGPTRRSGGFCSASRATRAPCERRRRAPTRATTRSGSSATAMCCRSPSTTRART